MVVVVEPGKPRNMDRRVYLTPKGKRLCDSYPYRVKKIEESWQDYYGADCVLTLRKTLESLDEDLVAGLPDFPDTTAWYNRRTWHKGAG